MAVDTLLAPVLTKPLAKVASESSTLGASNTIPDDIVLWRLSVEQYHAMAAAGILNEDDPVELLEGLLIDKMTKNPPHTTATRLISKALTRLAPTEWFVDTQEPITCADSEPEPDIIVIHGDIPDYQDRHPKPQDIGLVVEVADATLKRERGSKKRAYARAGIAVYWVVNLIENQIEVYTNPAGEGRNADYQTQQNYGLNDEVPVVIDGLEIARLHVRALLPEPA